MRHFRFDYAVAISFAGEDRKYAEGLAHELTKLSISVFYDDYERSLLWGKDLPTLLASVYRDRARYCVMFVSKHYVSKAYPVHERQHAIERQLRERGEDYILPVRIDDTELPDLPGTICYEDIRKTSLVELAHLLKEKLEDDGQHIDGARSVHPVLQREGSGLGGLYTARDTAIQILDRLAHDDFHAIVPSIHPEKGIVISLYAYIGQHALRYDRKQFAETLSS